ncbi:MAG: hypothetical protein ACXWDS_06675, partial [Actinomycetota bacterium]
LRRRALLNGVIAAFVTLVVGVGIVGTLTDVDGAEPSPSASASPTPSASQPVCTPTFEIAQSADPGDDPNTLLGLTVLSSAEAWAVGGSGDPEAPTAVLIERWDGTAWTAEEGPNPGSEINELRAVDAAEPNDVWAVGRTASGFGDRPLVLRYDGTAWTEVELPAEATGILTGVAAIASNDVWVVGFSGDPAASLERSVVLHWDGQIWSVVDPGRAVGTGRSALLGIEAIAPDDVWAVGSLHNGPLMIHFDGDAWSRSDTEVRGVTNAIAPVTPDDAWAAGSPIQRFDGSTWSDVAQVRSDGVLYGVAAVGPNDVWAVGARPVGEGSKALVMRFDGSRWTAVQGQSIPGSDELRDIDTLPDETVLAVGFKDVESGRRTLSIIASTCPPEA